MEYQVKIIQDVSVEPVTLAEIKAWSMIDADYAYDDTVLQLMIGSAREKLENYSNLAFGLKTLEVQFTGGYFQLPYGPTGTILSLFNVGEDPYADTDYTLRGLTFKSMCLDSDNSYEWFYPIGGGYPRLWNYYERYPLNTYNVTYTTGYTTLPRLLKEALLIQVDYDLKVRGLPEMAALSPVAVEKVNSFSRNLIL